MFRIDVPLHLQAFCAEKNGEAYVRELRKLSAQRVFLCATEIAEPDRLCRKIAAAKDFLEARGFEVGVWISSLFHFQYEKPYGKMVTADGKESVNIICPTDPEFVEDYCGFIKKLLTTGVKTLMLDDDFRINFNGHGVQCFCSRHMARYAARLGRPVRREEMRAQLLSGAPNAYRTAWLQESRQTLLDFAAAIRAAADEVAPDAALALCSAPALWGVDGAAAEDGAIAVELARVLAGKHRPYLRLNGGPMYISAYFQAIFHQRFTQAMEFDRLQARCCRGKGVTVIAENDSYPRPRYEVPAAYLELFELVARADGGYDGMLKYGLDYFAEVSYETGYADRAAENRALCEAVSEAFAGKVLTGVRLFAPFDNLRYRTCKRDAAGTDPEVAAVRLAGMRFLNDNAIPITDLETEPILIFGGAAAQAQAELLQNGAILDLEAAEILQARGTDVGLQAVGAPLRGGFRGDIELDCRNFEYFIEEDIHVPVTTPILRDAAPAPGARLLSQFQLGGRTLPGSYLYENAAGQRFYVLAFDADENQDHAGMFRSYCRQRQVIGAYRWLTGRSLDAVCAGHPDLYLLTKRSENALAVGLWNLSPDSIASPVVELGETFRSVRPLHGEARLEGRQVTLSRLPAFSFAGFVAER